MHRSFYSSAIFFAGLYIIIALISGIISIRLEERGRELHTFGSWYLTQSIISFIWSLILLKYFHYKQYWFTFWVLTVLIATTLFHLSLSAIVFSTNELTTSYIIATLTIYAEVFLMGISLIFSEAGRRPWLKAAGIFSCCFGLFMFISALWVFNSLTALVDGSGAKITQWSLLIDSIGPVFYILNFQNERTAIKELKNRQQGDLSGAINFVAIIALLVTLFLGSKLVIEIKRLPETTTYSEYQKKSAQTFEAGSYVNGIGETLQYRLLKPLDYDPMKKYPLIVCLHGSSGQGTDNVKQVSSSLMAQFLSTNENRLKYPAFLLVPQCPPKRDWGGIIDLPAVDSLILETIFALEQEFSINENRRYVTGISLGGYGTWHLICTQPDMFAAAIPICGAGNPTQARNIVDIPVWAFHGAKDRNVLVRGSRDMVDAIENAGGSPRYTEYPDEAHHISQNVKNTPGLLDWLFAQERK